MRESTVGTLLVLAAAVGFGTIGIFGEAAALVDLPLATLLPVRFVIATAAVATVAVARDWSLPAGRDRAWTVALGGVYAGITLCYFLSLRWLTAGLATVVLYTYPTLAVALGAVVLDEPITRRKLAALALAVGGVALIVGADPAGAAPTGVALALAAAAWYAVYTVGSRRLSPRVSTRGLLLGVLVGTTVSMLGFGAVDGRMALPAGRVEWGIVLGLVAVATVLPQLCFYEGVRRLEAGRVGVVSTAEPAVTVALGAVLLDEPVTPAVVAGGACVLGGVLLVRGRDDAGEGVDGVDAGPG